MWFALKSLFASLWRLSCPQFCRCIVLVGHTAKSWNRCSFESQQCKGVKNVFNMSAYLGLRPNSLKMKGSTGSVRITLSHRKIFPAAPRGGPDVSCWTPQRLLFVDPNLPIVTAFRTVLLNRACWYNNQAMAPSPASGSTAHQGDHS